MKDVIIMFMLYSFIGWLWETPYVSFRQKKWINRGFLYGPIIPIYGFASVTIMISMKLIEPYLPQEKWYLVIVAIIYISIVASVWEYITSFVLESAFQTRWWDYSEHKFNLNGRIALDYSIGWGIGGYILWKFINTPFIGHFYKLPYHLIEVVVAVFYTTLAIDAFITIRELISLRSIIIKLNSISDELSGKVVYNIGYLRDEIEEIINSKSVDIFKEEVRQYFEKLDNIKDVLEEKKNEINENILQVIQRKDIELSEKQLKSVQYFNMLLERSKQYSRFYRNYPKASSKRYAGIIHALKYKRNHEK
jgi:uncharacterized membrane protein